MLVAGVDEAGRGCVIGPLVIAGVLMKEENLPRLAQLGVKDSKLLSPKKREALAAEIARLAEKYLIMKLLPKEIDCVVESARKLHKLNRLEAQTMTQAIFPAYKGNAQIGVVFYSAPNGYSGKLHTLTSLDMKGSVRRVSVFSHSETPAYVGALNDGRYLRQFEGVALTDRLSFLIGRKAESRGDIQAMTGATDTSKPIALAVSEARKLFVELYGA